MSEQEEKQKLMDKAKKIENLMKEVGTHPIVLMRGLVGLEEHLSTLSDIQMTREEKDTLLQKAGELMSLLKEAGKHPMVRKLAQDELEKRLFSTGADK